MISGRRIAGAILFAALIIVDGVSGGPGASAASLRAPGRGAFTANGQQQTTMAGDTNCDGVVNAVDALQVLRFVAGLSSSQCVEVNGDVNCDGSINAVDGLLMLRYVAGLPVNLPVDCPPVGITPVTSEQLIAQSLASGGIDYQTSLLDRAYALTGDPHLPGQYEGNVIDIDSGTELFTEIAAHQGQLSAQTLSALAPFLARPNDPASVFSQNAPASGAASATGRVGARGAPRAPAAAPSCEQTGLWRCELVPDVPVRVWVRSDDQVGLGLDIYAGIVGEVWPKLRTLIRPPNPDQAGSPSNDVNPDSALDIYFVPLQTVDPRRADCAANANGAYCKFADAAGWTVPDAPFSANTSSAHILIDSSVQGDFLAGTLAHELFHASQFTYSYTAGSWLMESTAVWGEFRTLQQLGRGLNSVHRHLGGFFSTLSSVPLFSTDNFHQYGAYLYFFFAQMEKGTDDVVQDTWAAASPPGVDGLDAADQVVPFADNFREFALRNWNDDPVPDRYNTQDPTFPASKPTFTEQHILASGDMISLDVQQHPLTAAYYDIQVPPDSGIQNVKFKLGGVTGQQYAGVDAIVTIAGQQPVIQHWSGEGETSFCLDDPSEKLQDLVLIVSNANRKADLGGNIDIDTTKPCADFDGTITFTSQADGAGVDQSARPVTIHDSQSATISFEMTAKSGQPTFFDTSDGSVTWSVSDTETSPGTCQIVATNMGGGSYSIGAGLPGGGGPALFWKMGSGYVPNDSSYGLQILASAPDQYQPPDPSAFYHSQTDYCGHVVDFLWQPFVVIYASPSDPLGVLWGAIPQDGNTLTGSDSQTLPPLWQGQVPINKTVTWIIHHHQKTSS